MIFAKIDFINLLPLHVFFKKNIRSTQIKSIIEYKKSYPADINKKFHRRKINAAIISSIASKNARCLDMGIVAKSQVDSVLLLPASYYTKDYQSDTSNALALILEKKGRVLIGDKALQYFYENSSKEYEDLAKLWQEKYHLPFVFARLCFNSHHCYLKKLSKKFLHSKVKIPQYILQKYAKRSGLQAKQVAQYLEKISYPLGAKEKKALKLFLKLSHKKGLV